MAQVHGGRIIGKITVFKTPLIPSLVSPHLFASPNGPLTSPDDPSARPNDPFASRNDPGRELDEPGKELNHPVVRRNHPDKAEKPVPIRLADTGGIFRGMSILPMKGTGAGCPCYGCAACVLAASRTGMENPVLIRLPDTARRTAT
jgi:hypothetical protein